MRKALLIGGMVGIMGLVYNAYIGIDKAAYNNGVCQECGSKLEYTKIVQHSSYIEYEYECISCGNTIRTETKF